MKTLEVFIRKNVLLLFAVIIAVITHWFWFFEKGPFTRGDWSYFTPETLKDAFTTSFSWNSFSNGMGGGIIGNGAYPIFAAYGFLAYFFNFDSSQADFYFYFLPIILAAPISSYILLRYLTKSNIAGFIGSLVYSYNTYFILIQNGHPLVATANALTPFVVLYFIKTIEEISLRYCVATAVIFSMLSQYEPRIAYIVSFIMIFYLSYNLLITKENIFKKTGLTIFIFAILVLINTYWLLVLLYPTSFSSIDFLKRGLFGDSFANLRQAIFSFHPFWTDNGPAIFTVQPIPLRFFIIPFIAFSLFLFRKIDRKVAFFSITALVGIFLVKQSAAPLPNAYSWLYNHFPGFNAFRESSKFYLIINLSYAVLIGYTVSRLYELIEQHIKIKHSKKIFILIVALIFLWNTYPLITQKMPLTKSITIPNEYIEIKNYLLKQADYFRTMGVPRTYRYFFFNNTHPTLNADMIAPNLLRNYTLNPLDMEIFKRPYMNWLLDTASVKYVYIPYDSEKEMFDYVDDNGELVKGYGGKRGKLEKMLDNLDWLSNKQYFGKTVVYENKGYLQHIYATQYPPILIASDKVSPLDLLAYSSICCHSPLLFILQQNTAALQSLFYSITKMTNNAQIVFANSNFDDLLVDLAKAEAAKGRRQEAKGRSQVSEGDRLKSQKPILVKLNKNGKGKFKVKGGGVYEVWIKNGQGLEVGGWRLEGRGWGLEVNINGEELEGWEGREGDKWVRIGEVELEKGKHILKAIRISGYPDIREKEIKLVLLNREEKQNLEKEIWEMMNKPQTEVCYIFEKEKGKFWVK